MNLAVLAAVVVVASGYAYHGVLRGHPRATVILNRAGLGAPGSHVSVWDGASNAHATVWVQAGIEFSGGRPYLYAEAADYPHNKYSLNLRPTRLNRRKVVKVVRRGDRWRAIIGRLATRWVTIRDANLVAALEIYRGAHAVAHINGHRVT